MAEISVIQSARGRHEFDVAVAAGGRTSTYQVSVPPELPEQFGGVEPDRLVRASFVFLLEREPPSSILPRFSLSVIPNYFPEYADEMSARLGG